MNRRPLYSSALVLLTLPNPSILFRSSNAYAATESTPTSLFTALDYDFETAKQLWDTKRGELDAADQVLKQKLAILSQQEQLLTSATNRVNQLQSQIQSLQNNEATTTSDIANGRATIQRLQSDRDTYTNNLRALRSDLRAEEDRRDILLLDINTDESQLENLRRQIADLQSTNPQSPDLPRLRNDYNTVDNRLKLRRSQLSRIDSNINTYKTDIANLQNSLDQANRSITSETQRIQSLESSLASIRSSLSSAQNQLVTARSEQDSARSRRDSAQVNVNSAQNRYDAVYYDERAAYAHYQQILSNYNSAYAAAVQRGQNDAQGHSLREAKERAEPVGQTDGTGDGETTGKSAGLLDSQKIADSQGYNYGLSRGGADPDLQVSYQSGQQEGSVIADRKAHGEDYPASYNSELFQVLGAPPTRKASYDIVFDLPDIPGATGPRKEFKPLPLGPSVSPPQFQNRTEPTLNIPAPGNPSPSVPPTDRRYYSPGCSNEPLPVFNEACARSYENSYVSAYQSSFVSSYKTAYDSAFRTASDKAYRSARQTTQPAIYVAASNLGAKNKGVLDGFSARLPLARQEEKANGLFALAANRRTGYMALLREVSLVQAVDDDNYTPGETVKLKAVLDNYGLVNAAKSSLRLRVSDLSNLNFTAVSRSLPALEGDTRVTIEGVLPATIAAVNRGKIKLKVSLEELDSSGQATLVDEGVFENNVRTPLEFSSVQLPSGLIIGQEATASLTLKNNTNAKISAQKASIALRGDGLTSTVTSIDIPEIEAGQNQSVSLTVKPNEFASSTVPVDFILKTADVSGGVGVEQLSRVAPNVARVGELELCLPTCGTPVSLPLSVRPGGTFRIPSRFVYKGSRSSMVEFGVLEVSDRRITNASGGTIRVGPGQWSAGTIPYSVNFMYDVSRELAGTTQWVSLYVAVNNVRTQVLKVPFNVTQ